MVLRREDLADSLQALIPRGSAWRFTPDSVFRALLEGLADELVRLYARAGDLLAESDPRQALELLPEWEDFVGLPDTCTGLLPSVLLRRSAVVARITRPGGQSRAHFLALAELLGYVIEIEEVRPFEVGRSSAGEFLTNGPWVFVWRVHAPAFNPFFFSAGASGAGEPLVTFATGPLECAIDRARPAHTRVEFVYDLPLTGWQPWGLYCLPAPATLQMGVHVLGIVAP